MIHRLLLHLIESTTSKIQRLQHAFSELESHRAITLNLKWNELEERCHGLEGSLKKRFDELEDQEKAYESKISETQEMLEKKEAIIVAKEQVSLGRLQKTIDAAFSAMEITLERCKMSSSLPVANGPSANDLNVLSDEEPHLQATLADSEAAELTQYANAINQPCSPLMKLCQEMDVEELHEYISENRKDLASIREEIPVALGSSSSSLNLVLDSLKDFYRPAEMQAPYVKKDANLLGLRRTSLMLMEFLGQSLAELIPVPENLIISSVIKGKAKAIAE